MVCNCIILGPVSVFIDNLILFQRECFLGSVLPTDFPLKKSSAAVNDSDNRNGTIQLNCADHMDERLEKGHSSP